MPFPIDCAVDDDTPNTDQDFVIVEHPDPADSQAGKPSLGATRVVARSSAAIASPGSLDSWVASVDHVGLPAFADFHAKGREDSWTDAPPSRFPNVGSCFLGFHLVGELGRGAFGRVYLARQDDLAGRLVALKVSTEVRTESHNLARLQHTHIVPVYSVHRAGTLQAVCMPYFGSATLADALGDLHRLKGLPASGKGLVSTIQDRAGRTKTELDRSSTQNGSAPAPAVAPSALLAGQVEPPGPVTLPAEEAPTLRMLEGLSYVDAVLWIGERLADGLAHAHERGILHRDLKPANILLTDDGQPMLLDFNLSAEVAPNAARARVGGTLPYMAPEHLASFAGLPAPFPQGATAAAVADARSDVFALGVILYEMLAGQAPFEQTAGHEPDQLPRMIAGRLGSPPRVRVKNRKVSPAVESILQHCLEADPARRYQTARQLAEDLQCQRCDQPLAHAREKSICERSCKWLRRNRRHAVVAAGLLAIVCVLGLAGTLRARDHRLGEMEAVATLSTFFEDSDEARLLLAARPRDIELRREGLRIAQRALARYDVLGQPNWLQKPEVQRLSAEDRQRLEQAIGELALLTAGIDEADEKTTLLERAGDCFPADEAPRALYLQRAEQASRRGNRDEAEVWREWARGCPVHGAMDHYLLARERLGAGQVVAAIEQLREVVRLDPKHLAAWYLLGNCYLDGTTGLAQGDDEAIRCFSVCVALRPGFHGSYFNRGLVRERQKQIVEAEADFNTALKLRPRFADGRLHRGLVREKQGKLREALADYTRAIDIGTVPSRTWFARARLRKQLGDKAGARQDEQEGLRRPPRDEESFLLRGQVRAATDPRGALEDFRAAVAANPRSLPGMYNQAQLLAERLGRVKDAVAALDEAIKLHPDRVELRISRGVLRARLGLRAAAHADGVEALRLDKDSSQVLYQVACIHAQTSRVRAGDRNSAFRLLFRAVKQGFGHNMLETDPDLAPLRKDARFEKIREVVRAVETW